MVPCSVEIYDSIYLWSEAYRLLRLRGLSPLEKSNLFCIVHELLPSKERVHRFIPTTSPTCDLCEAEELDTYQHSFFSCSSNREAASAMLQCAKSYDSDLNEFRCDIRADDPFALPSIFDLG